MEQDDQIDWLLRDSDNYATATTVALGVTLTLEAFRVRAALPGRRMTRAVGTIYAGASEDYLDRLLNYVPESDLTDGLVTFGQVKDLPDGDWLLFAQPARN